MAKHNKSRSRNKPHNSAPPPATPKGGNIDSEPNAQAKANDCKYVKQEPPNIYVNIPPPEKEKWGLANKIAFFSVLINVGLAIFTYLLFREASTQSDQTEQNSKPYIEISLDSVRMRPLTIGMPVVTDFAIVNLKDVTTKIISTQTWIAYEDTIVNIIAFKERLDSGIRAKGNGSANEYLTKETPLRLHATTPYLLTVEELRGVLSHKFRYYFMGAITYMNLTHNKLYRYYFNIKITINPVGGFVEFISNENEN